MGSQWEMQPQQAEPAVPTTVLLKGLPNGMCASSAYMEVVLDEAGLDGCVVDIKVTQGNPCGRAVIKFSSWHSAAHCIRHFSGCVWDEAGMPVSACFAKTKSSHAKSTREPTSSELGAPQGCAAIHRAREEGRRQTSYKAPSASDAYAPAACYEAPPVSNSHAPAACNEAPSSKMTRPSLMKQTSHEDSDGSASGSTRGSTRSAKSTSPSLSPQSRPLWADIVSDDED